MSLTTLNLNAHLMHVHLVCAIFQIDAVQTIVHIFFQYMMVKVLVMLFKAQTPGR